MQEQIVGHIQRFEHRQLQSGQLAAAAKGTHTQ
jgi:hypothetical protein